MLLLAIVNRKKTSLVRDLFLGDKHLGHRCMRISAPRLRPAISASEQMELTLVVLFPSLHELNS